MTPEEKKLLELTASVMAGHLIGHGGPGSGDIAQKLIDAITAQYPTDDEAKERAEGT
jgi:hypothetical protein